MNTIQNIIRTILLLGFGTIAAQNPLLIPPSLSGTDITLTLDEGTHQFFSGTTTNTMGANGDILGPTLILDQGQQINFTVENNIADITTMHWHGMHVSSANDGGPHTTIAPGASWTPSFTVLDKAATYWYHPHLHMKTNEHVSKGIAGMIIVRDTEEAALDLPRTYGVDDFPLVIQTKDFDANNQIVVPSNSDDIVMVNATVDPSLDVPEQVVRYRLLNGSSMRVFNIGLSGDKTFYQIASDGGLLEDNVSLTRLRLSPGERAEILVDFTGEIGNTIYLKSYASELPNGIYGATNPGMGPGMQLNGYNPNPLNGTDFDIIQFDVVATTSNPVTSIESPLVSVTPWSQQSSDITRELTMRPVTFGPQQLNGNFTFDFTPFDENVINVTVPFGNTEIWSITNNSGIAHPFHIHDVQFYILERNGVAPLPGEAGRKDVLLIRPQENIKFITKFEDFGGDTIPYMYHCHMLIHEDGGMMHQFVVEANPLPVTWSIPTNAILINDQVKVTWAVESQTNNDAFYVQHSVDGFQFSTIKTIIGDNNSLESKNYSILHEHPQNGTNYYRIKQWDIDGRISYSNTAQVKYSKGDVFSAYPNPAISEIEVFSSKDQLLTIYDQAGKLLTVSNLNKGLNSIDMTSYPKGNYIFNIGNKSISVVKME